MSRDTLAPAQEPKPCGVLNLALAGAGPSQGTPTEPGGVTPPTNIQGEC